MGAEYEAALELKEAIAGVESAIRQFPWNGAEVVSVLSRAVDALERIAHTLEFYVEMEGNRTR